MSSSRPGPSTEAERIDGLASLLIDARTEHRSLDSVPAEFVPVDEVEAEKVEDRVAAMAGWPVLGWKIGCTSEHAQRLLGASRPFAGRVYTRFDGGAELAPADLANEPQLEGEFAFTLGRDIVGAPGREQVLDAVAHVRPAIEVVGGRYTSFVGMPLTLLSADAGANTHLVLGRPRTDVDLDGLAAIEADMVIDGSVTGRGRGADVLGDPVAALVWLVEHLAARNISLRAGQTITTGTATQLSHLPPGSTATATLHGIGSVTVSRAA